jgi:pilus assembly protein Flp/PilA
VGLASLTISQKNLYVHILSRAFDATGGAVYFTPGRQRRLGSPLMKSFVKKLRRFLFVDEGPTAVEYAVMLMLIVLVCLSAITTIGQKVNSIFSKVGSSI